MHSKKLRQLTTILTLISILVSCGNKTDKTNRTDNKVLIGRLSTKELINTDFNRLQRKDSLFSFTICKQYPIIHEWDNNLFALVETLPKKYLEDNLEHEREKSIKEFLKNNWIYDYNWEHGDVKLKGYITKYKTNPSEWLNDGFKMSIYLTDMSGTQIDPILISKYMHFLLITEYEIGSITNIYSDNSIEFITKDNTCSDVEILGQGISCDSTRITTKYNLDGQTNKIIKQSDTIRFEY